MGNMSPNTSFSYTEFLLLGFPEIYEFRHLLVIPFLLIYIVTLLGNSLVSYAIWVDNTLHSPMYVLISTLLVSNISYTTTVMPKFLLSIAFQLNQITLSGCLNQMFFIYAVGICESNILLLMALDRYVAICKPLRYHNIVTNRLLVQLFIIGLFRSTFLGLLLVFFASTIEFCRSNIILNFSCENMSVLSLGCGDISKIQLVGLVVRIIIVFPDGSLVLVSYLSILYTLMKSNVGQSWGKAWKTCSTHLIVTMLTHSCGLVSSIIYRVNNSLSLNGQNLVSLVNFLIPATMDPVIYGFRMTEIKRSLTARVQKMHLCRTERQ
ncbi:olfactory receptor 52Z1-like [Pelobates cultripes]|uniref:Olfactory receptor n=1 Tax=Pelobates cultripes TaxID=61616 RepID=A0AAD1WRC9_PELCU|nr:olfactory receptor 52Z1-like [Pelobates cultripes]